MHKPLREKRCRSCKESFRPMSTLAKVCSLKCALELVQKEKSKQRRKETREARERLMTRQDWIKKVQPVFNRHVRLRDKNQPCISCGRYDGEIQEHLRGGKWDCGHFLSVGAHPELRFEPDNAHKQCKSCNGGSGKYTQKNHTVGKDYRINLIQRIGIEKVEWLEGPHEPAKWTIPELQELGSKFSSLAKEAA